MLRPGDPRVEPGDDEERGGTPPSAEISGHFHPKATVRVHGRRVTGRCFVTDGARLIMPAFGAYAGGLDVFDPAIRRHFPYGFDVHLIGRSRITRFEAASLSPASPSFDRQLPLG
jgi:metallophosphoesterase superfamily enzyme